ncbi:MAG TPA: peptidylprolyl isomerase [Acidimicrobiales bacterium]
MRPLTRLLPTAALLAIVPLTATSCDTSPYAAVANKHVIKQTALNAELRNWSANKQYVAAFDSANGQSGVTVAGFAPGTYNSAWVASILSNIVTASLIHHSLSAHQQAPDIATLSAARAVSEISQIGWTSFTPAFRNTLSMRLAEDAAITPPSIGTATLQRVYQQYKQYFFSQVCLLEAATFSLQQAQQLSASTNPGGSEVCYDQARFENQSSGFRQAVMQLGVNGVSQPIKTSYGYQVVQVTSRTDIGFTPQVQRTISVAIINAQGAPNTVVQGLLTSARVKVNPEYGSWSQGQVVPPKSPGSSQ